MSDVHFPTCPHDLVAGELARLGEMSLDERQNELGQEPDGLVCRLRQVVPGTDVVMMRTHVRVGSPYQYQSVTIPAVLISFLEDCEERSWWLSKQRGP